MVLLSTVAALLSLALALAAPQQIPFSRASSPTFAPSPALAYVLAQLPADHALQLQQHIDTWPEPRTVRFSDDEGDWATITEGHKALLRLEGRTFVDVTDDVDYATTAVEPDEEHYPHKIRHNATSLAPLFKHVHLPEMEAFLANFTSFFNRYYRSDYGVQSQQFLLSHLQSLHATHNPHANVTFTAFPHSTWAQRTLILRWTSPSVPADAPAVLISAHQDSTNRLPFLRAPGADDDGSGTTALVAVFAALLRGGWQPSTNPVEVMFFSAEEGGLLGSGEVARRYREEGRQVRAMYHMDVVGFVKNGTTPSIGLITDGVSPSLTAYLARLIPRFSKLPVAQTKCGYMCSDHGRFFQAGYPAACLSEGRFEDSSPMHSAQDTADQPEFSFVHIREFVHIALGYIVELAGWEGA
ncbi:hypothetical protein JCM10449v2_006985 [Rhodotorula kratochvilovae]